MKRSRTTESPAADDKLYRRQLPVSCTFCRNKKLKCDREIPCSNCAARGIECESAVTGRKSGLGDIAVARTAATSRLSQDDILARFQRLEQAVFRGKPPSFEGAQEGFATYVGSLTEVMHTPTGWQSIDGGPPIRTREHLNQAAHEHSPRSAQPTPSGLHPPTGDNSKSILPANAAPAVQDLSQMMLRTSKYEAFLLGDPDRGAASSQESTTSFIPGYSLGSILPPKPIADRLFDHFVDNVSWVYRIYHTTTCRNDMNDIYDGIRVRSKVTNVRKLSLIATILASAAQFWAPQPDVAFSEADARAAALRWTDLATKALIEANHQHEPSIETLQATIIMGQFLPGTAGPKRTFLGTVVHSARTLGLHQTDSRRNCQRRMETEHDLADLEVRRRLWWHIVATDWMICYMSGPQEGTYLCHPDQMNCLLPCNADDKDITPTSIISIDLTAPNAPPTEMTYSLAKVWLATIMRSFADTACAAGLEVDELEYDQVLRLDEQANACMKQLPYFFQLDDISRRRSEEIVRQRPYIGWQRELLHFGFHTRLSRLHRPFMTRGYKDPKYAYSRMICLRSARVVIELEKTMRDMGNVMHQQTTSRLWIIIHHFFMATVTLVMDYCCHRDDPRASERREEILECYRVLERNQEESPIARKGLAHLRQVMNDWRAEGSADGRKDANGETGTNSAQQPMSSDLVNGMEAPMVGSTNDAVYETPMIVDMAGLDPMGINLAQDLWFDNGFGTNYDPQWDALFNALENQPGIYGM